MALADKIQASVQKLPLKYQAEVLDFVEFLLERADFSGEAEPADLSLTLAMRGMETEETPAYSLADLTLVFA